MNIGNYLKMLAIGAMAATFALPGAATPAEKKIVIH